MRARNNVCPTTEEASPWRRGIEHFSYNFYTCTNPFIHLLGSLLIQWMIVRINGREKPKQDLQVHLGEAMLRLGEALLCLGEALLCLGGQESAETLASGSPRHSDLRLGVHSYAEA